MALEVATLEANLEEEFWKHVSQDPLNYYFFIFDWKLQKKNTEILLALEEGKIEGIMLTYKQSIVQLRGNRKAVKTLLDHLDLEKVELTAPKECEDIVLKRYKPSRKYEIIIMHLEKGDERILKQHEPIEPFFEDAEQIANLMRNSYPDFWGETTAEKVKKSMEENHWLAQRDDDKIVSVGNTRFADFGSNIGVVATDEAYRNRGYATSIVSALIMEILQRYERALIHVLGNNHPAIHIYRKVGFKQYNSYLLVKGERIQSEHK
ncbi:MAG: GNAT family N-acetyltransferase [Thermoplasmata archaeon]